MERIETAGRRVCPRDTGAPSWSPRFRGAKPSTTPLTVLRALVRRGVRAVGYWVAWTWDAVVTDQKQMYHDFLRSRFVQGWRAFLHAPALVGFSAALRDNCWCA